MSEIKEFEAEVYANLLVLNFLKSEFHKQIYMDFIKLYLKEGK